MEELASGTDDEHKGRRMSVNVFRAGSGGLRMPAPRVLLLTPSAVLPPPLAAVITKPSLSMI